MLISSVSFEGSSPRVNTCPATALPEFAFIGRSNVGKSSLINMIIGKKGVAKTSSTPGKTQLINHFLINESWFLADLPGYGYARVSQQTRAQWLNRMKEYLLKRENLSCVFLLIDGCIPFQKQDHQMITWLGEKQIPFVLIITKSDKTTQHLVQKNIDEMQKALLLEWETLPAIFITSSKSKRGRKEILDFISSVIIP
ncbi:MAG: ribosome biogenesis GTP-binding protein YihA/YsxC [Flavobacteriales bacterium]|nr:ribosome biogenesis GTP-binding protein YihA/YsxC [Flavobacteriales bacterium]